MGSNPTHSVFSLSVYPARYAARPREQDFPPPLLSLRLLRLPRRFRRWERPSRWHGALALLLAVPLLVAGGAASAFYLHLHQASESMRASDLASAARPSSPRRILVLSPHCDDETLGAGALIADARASGVPVSVAFLTNGDGFRVAASQALGEMRVSPADYVRFAKMRQQEALLALSELGVASPNVLFLGYPDRGLKALWEANWGGHALYRSPYTGQTHSPYARSLTPRAPYCGEALLADLVRVMAQTRPTDIYVTHPADDHPDHCTAAAFAEAALRIARAQPETQSWARSARLHFYLVHRGDWPLPQGLHPQSPLVPPPGLAHLDTRWSAYRATPEARAAKSRALIRYTSQTAILGRFMQSFTRTNELFGDLPSETLAMGNEATSALAVAPDGVNDDLMRFATPAADLTGIAVRVVGSNTPSTLQIKLMLRGPVSRRVRYTLLLRGSGDAASSPAAAENPHFLSLQIPVSALDLKQQARALQVSVPLAALGLRPGDDDCVWVGAETSWAGRLPVDRLSYRPFDLRPVPFPRQKLVSVLGAHVLKARR